MPSPSIATILRDHVSLSISCVDRLYLNGYVPLLQTPGRVATFCRQQLNAPIASPALFRPLLERFTHAVDAFAEQHNVPIIHFSASALRFGDVRVHALLQAISHFSVVPEGFQNRDLRPLVAALLGRQPEAYSRGAMTYDLRRLRLHGLIQRVPRSHRYMVTLDGWQVAGFYNTLYHHILRPGWAVLADPTSSTPEPIATAVRHLADTTRAVFQQLHPEPNHSNAAA